VSANRPLLPGRRSDSADGHRMSEAIEGSEVFVYCVSERYKESANCRMECNYVRNTSNHRSAMCVFQWTACGCRPTKEK
jgi:hypothetical protein